MNYASATSPGNETASWVYDNANGALPASTLTYAKGHATTVTTYASGYAYTLQQISYNVFGESTSQVVEIPSGAPGSAMGAYYLFSSTYQAINGTLVKRSYPSGGGLPSETVTHTTTGALDLPSVVGGLSGYAGPTSYNAWSQPEQVTIGAGSSEAYITSTYDPHTRNLASQLVTRSTATPADVSQTSYTYTPAGN